VDNFLSFITVTVGYTDITIQLHQVVTESPTMTHADERQPLLEGQHDVVKPDHSAIPDGGIKAWSQVIGSFFLMFNCW
jgi:hypothetical protein